MNPEDSNVYRIIELLYSATPAGVEYFSMNLFL